MRQSLIFIAAVFVAQLLGCNSQSGHPRFAMSLDEGLALESIRSPAWPRDANGLLAGTMILEGPLKVRINRDGHQFEFASKSVFAVQHMGQLTMISFSPSKAHEDFSSTIAQSISLLRSMGVKADDELFQRLDSLKRSNPSEDSAFPLADGAVIDRSCEVRLVIRYDNHHKGWYYLLQVSPLRVND